MARPDFPKLIADADLALREGRSPDARALLLSLDGVTIPREHAAPLAALARRTNDPELGLRWLHPIVRVPEKVVGSATERERIVYAGCLARIGALEEAEDILGRVGDRAPEALLFRHQIVVARWDYRAAIPLLERFLSASGTKAYDRLLAKVNLADALVYERHHRKVQPLLRELIHETGVRKLWLLQGATLQFAAVDAFRRKKWDQCSQFLEKARETMRRSDTLDALFVKKWEAFLRLRREGAGTATLAAVAEVRAEAGTKRHWETVRDCDRMIAIETASPEAATRVYFGTPFPSFRDWLVADLKGRWAPPASYAWRVPGGEGGPAAKALDLRAPDALKGGQAVHRLLLALTRDFYRPARLATLFARLNPGEFYHPESAKARVYDVIGRAREWLASQRLPLRIEAEDGFYRLNADAPCAVHVGPEVATVARGAFLLERLREAFPSADFSSRDAITVLGVSERAARRLLLDAVGGGRLTRFGKGIATRYRFVEAPARAARG